jgi:hypothetical protein
MHLSIRVSFFLLIAYTCSQTLLAMKRTGGEDIEYAGNDILISFICPETGAVLAEKYYVDKLYNYVFIEGKTIITINETDIVITDDQKNRLELYYNAYKYAQKNNITNRPDKLEIISLFKRYLGIDENPLNHDELFWLKRWLRFSHITHEYNITDDIEKKPLGSWGIRPSFACRPEKNIPTNLYASATTGRLDVIRIIVKTITYNGIKEGKPHIFNHRIIFQDGIGFGSSQYQDNEEDRKKGYIFNSNGKIYSNLIDLLEDLKKSTLNHLGSYSPQLAA